MHASLAALPLVVAILAPASVPPPSTDEQLAVADVTALSIDGEARSLSPDGTLLAGIGETADGADTICVWAVDGGDEPTCADELLPITSNPLYSTIRWSPDGTRLAFDLDVVRTMVDSDLFVFDVTTGEVSNLTDDGFEGNILTGRTTPVGSEPAAPPEIVADIVPAWSPDGTELAFSRSSIGEATRDSSLLRIPAGGGDPMTVLHIGDEPFSVWTPMFWRPDDTIVYTHLGVDPDDPQNGIWTVPADGGDPERVIDGDGTMPQIVAVDVAGSTVSLVSLSRFNLASATYEDPLFWIADVDTATAEPLPSLALADDAALPQSSIDLDGDTAVPVVPPAISPDGSTALAVYRVFRSGELRLVAFDLADFTATPIGDGALLADDVSSVHSLQWATDDRILIVTGDGPVIVDLAAA